MFWDFFVSFSPLTFDPLPSSLSHLPAGPGTIWCDAHAQASRGGLCVGGRVTERGANERTDYGLKPRIFGRALPGSNGRTEGGEGRKPPAPLHRRFSISSSPAQVRLFFQLCLVCNDSAATLDVATRASALSYTRRGTQDH